MGQKLDVIVLELDVDGRKLSLGHKQTTDNPWEKYSETYSEGSIHELSITDIVDKGATIKLNEDINALSQEDIWKNGMVRSFLKEKKLNLKL